MKSYICRVPTIYSIFRWSPEYPVSQIQSPYFDVSTTGIFSDLLRSVQILKWEWGAESNGKLPHLFIPSKTATFVPEFAVKDLPLGRTPWWWWWFINNNFRSYTLWFLPQQKYVIRHMSQIYFRIVFWVNVYFHAFLLYHLGSTVLANPYYLNLCCFLGAKVDWDFRISDLVKNPDGTDV